MLNSKNMPAGIPHARPCHDQSSMEQECGCCFETFARSLMVHCNASSVVHWFCTNCARQAASSAIELEKIEFTCMALEVCRATFSQAEIEKFLPKKEQGYVKRLEAHKALRERGVKNIETCPFCWFPAECLPSATVTEFRCQNMECQKTSCLFCRKKKHWLRSCKSDRYNPLQHLVEEAMSCAVIRKCHSCGTAFVKNSGCNRVQCTKCGNYQCYLCARPNIDYAHFNDEGPCRLYTNEEDDNDNIAHQQEADMAMEAAFAKLRAKHPWFSEECIKMRPLNKYETERQFKADRRLASTAQRKAAQAETKLLRIQRKLQALNKRLQNPPPYEKISGAILPLLFRQPLDDQAILRAQRGIRQATAQLSWAGPSVVPARAAAEKALSDAKTALQRAESAAAGPQAPATAALAPTVMSRTATTQAQSAVRRARAAVDIAKAGLRLAVAADNMVQYGKDIAARVARATQPVRPTVTAPNKQWMVWEFACFAHALTLEQCTREIMAAAKLVEHDMVVAAHESSTAAWLAGNAINRASLSFLV